VREERYLNARGCVALSQSQQVTGSEQRALSEHLQLVNFSAEIGREAELWSTVQSCARQLLSARVLIWLQALPAFRLLKNFARPLSSSTSITNQLFHHNNSHQQLHQHHQ